jgi:hypothetical protein
MTTVITVNDELKSKQKIGCLLRILPVLTTLQILSILPEFEPLQIAV